MGGGEIPERLRVPHYTTYSYENVNKFPELVKYQQQLAKDGLKDPWLRNIFWIYQTSPRYTNGKRNYFRNHGAFMQGMVAATVAFGIYALIDQARIRYFSGDKTGSEHGHH